MNPLNRRLFILLLSLGSCVTTTGCFSCTEVHNPPPQVTILCLSKNLNPDVLMMEPAEDRYRSDATDLLLPPELRSIFVQ